MSWRRGWGRIGHRKNAKLDALMLIRNYGLFWEREEIPWGTTGPGNRGQLPGFLGRSETTVDFREQAGVYVLYDGQDIPSLKLVYVGQAGRGNASLFSRLKQHTTDHLWNRWTRFSWFGIYPVVSGVLDKRLSTDRLTSKVVLDIVEGLLIKLMEPPLNRQGARWKSVDEYVQAVADVDAEDEEVAEAAHHLRSNGHPQLTAGVEASSR